MPVSSNLFLKPVILFSQDYLEIVSNLIWPSCIILQGKGGAYIVSTAGTCEVSTAAEEEAMFLSVEKRRC